MTKAKNLFKKARLLRVAEILVYDGKVDLDFNLQSYFADAIEVPLQLVEFTLPEIWEGSLDLVTDPIEFLVQRDISLRTLPPSLGFLLSILVCPISLLGVVFVITIFLIILCWICFVLLEYLCIEVLMGKLLTSHNVEDEVEAEEWLGKALDMEQRFSRIIENKVTSEIASLKISFSEEIRLSNNKLENLILQFQEGHRSDRSISPPSHSVSR